jgi:hypothetical protein
VLLGHPDDDGEMLILWGCGFDTFDIAARYGITQAEADRRLWRAREQRRVSRQGKAYMSLLAELHENHKRFHRRHRPSGIDGGLP